MIRILFIVVLILLVGFLLSPFPKSNRPKFSSNNATQSLINAVGTAILTYHLKTWTWEESTPNDPTAKFKKNYLWDLNNDGFIDGRPAEKNSETTDGGFSPALLKTNYLGFLQMVKPTIHKKFVKPNFQLIDAWGNLLRIDYDYMKYPIIGLSVWSIGPDGINGTSDDISYTQLEPTPPVGPAAIP